MDSANINREHPGDHEVSVEVLQSLRPHNVPPAKLKLKLGCPLIVMRNLSIKRGLCNGTRVMLTGIRRRVLQVRLPDGQYEMIPLIKLMVEERSLPWVLNRSQFPAKLVFMMTINKAQEQSLEVVGVDLRDAVFTHGQLYVALSREMSVAGVRILMKADAQGLTEHIVFLEVLLRPPFDT